MLRNLSVKIVTQYSHPKKNAARSECYVSVDVGRDEAS